MKTLLQFIFFSLVSITSIAQNFSITGTVGDETNLTLAGATVSIIHPEDSVLIKATSAVSDGTFKIENVVNGNYIMKISFIGYHDFYKNISLKNESLVLGILKIQKTATSLNQANVQGTVIPTVLKGDTTEHIADAYKTQPDANAEELVTKMPGITTTNGKVQAQGEDIKQVTVDGKPFFGDDPTTVLKNIPAEIIDKIQVFDKKSDQAQFTGFDDGNTSKTMNIVTRQRFRNGTFGRVFGGYGTDETYKAGLSLNFYKDKRRISILAQSNNINEQNFSSEDLLGVMSSTGGGNRGNMPRGAFGAGGGPRGGGGGPRMQGGGGNDASNFLVDQKSGITTTNAIGINYVDKWKKVDFTGSYFLNYTDNKATSDLFRQYITGQTAGYSYSENKIQSSKNTNHRINLKFDIKLDSSNSVLIQPKFSLQKNDGGSNLFGTNNLYDTLVVSNTTNDFTSNLTAINLSAPILYRHSFTKKGRTISLNLTPGYNTNKGNSMLYTLSNYYSDTLTIDTINQLNNLDKQGITSYANLTYTEPLGTKSQLQLSYSNNYNITNSDKETFTPTSVENKYTVLDTTLSNTFKSTYFSNSVNAGYRYNVEKMNFMIGAAYQIAQLKNAQQFPTDYNLNKQFNSILPNAMLQYNFSKSKNIRINYRSSNNAPSVDQLQEVVNNSNPLQLTTGNSDLKQDFQQNLFLRYSAVNTAKSQSFFAMLMGSTTSDYIGNSTFFASSDTAITPEFVLPAGSQISKPVNLKGYYNLRTFLNYSFVVKKLKTNFNLNANASTGRTPGLINFETNNAQNTSAGVGIVLSSNISEKVDFSISTNPTMNWTENSLQTESNSKYLNVSSRFKINVLPWKGLVLQSDLNHQYYNGLSQNYNENYYLWNAAIGYKFLKDKVAELRISVYDILNQNTNITRNTTDTYYEDVKSNVLQRYFMLTFTYNPKFFKETKK